MKTYSFTGAAEFLNTSETTFGDLVTTGQIPGAKIGQSWVFREDDLDAYLRREVDRQTAERIEAYRLGVPAKVKTARGSTRNQKPVLPDLGGIAA